MNSFNLSDELRLPDVSSYIKMVEHQLQAAVNTDERNLWQPLQRLVRAPSKRLRSIFLLTIALALGSDVDHSLMDSCVSLELMHLASLIHDDIIDEAQTRWHLPTINSQEGTGRAIVSGDYLFAKSLEWAAKISQDAAGLMSKTLAGLSEGQSQEMADQFNLDRSITSLERAHLGKTASLFAAAAQLAGLHARLSPADVKSLARYGENFGLAFQQVDDLLDILSNEKLLGKPVGNDIVEGTYTLPIILSLKQQGGDTLRKKLSHRQAIDNDWLATYLIEDGSVVETIHKIQTYNQTAIAALTKLGKKAPLLKKVPAAYLNTALIKYTAKPYRPLITNLLA